MMYYSNFEGEGPRIREHPGWFSDETGELLNDAQLTEQGLLPIKGSPPMHDPRSQIVETLPLEQWGYTDTFVTRKFQLLDLPLLDVAMKRVEEVRQLSDSKLETGYPVPGTSLFIAYDSDTRTDMSGMTLQSILATLGSPWPEGYRQGFIALNNERVPLPTPQDGQRLAEGYGNYYAGVKQHARSVKDALLALPTVSALLAFDINIGWPE